MTEIPLTKGYVAIVDEEDLPRLRQRSWHANIGNQVRALSSWPYKIYMHQFILNVQSGQEIDHINGNPLDNRKTNLRLVSHQENMLNGSRHKNRVGVCFNKRAKLWIAYLDRPKKTRKYLGYRKSKEEALLLVEEARKND